MKEKDLLDSLFEKARNEKPQVSLKQTLETFEKSVAHNSMSSLSKFLTLKNIVIMITTSILVSSIIYFALPTENESSIASSERKEEAKIIVEEKPETEIVIETDSIFFKEKKAFEPIERLKIKSVSGELQPNRTVEKIKSSNRFPQKMYTPSGPPKYYPKLTEKEIKENHKQKKRMLKSLVKSNSKDYALIVGKPVIVDGDTVSVQMFKVQKNEVTNLEYITFLFDLIIQGRKAEFDIAKPDQEQWVEQFGENMKPMQDMYFSHPAFDNYPVVNITPEGAQLYCKWLREEAQKILKVNINPVRIPYKSEWIMAATAAGQHQTYPWKSYPDSIVNEEGCFLANFRSESYHKGSLDGAELIAKTETYVPNNFGLYNIAGNVAELVINSKTGEFSSMGGSWNDDKEKLKINYSESAILKEKGQPTVGFRVVITETRTGIRKK